MDYTKYCEIMGILQLHFCILKEEELVKIIAKEKVNIENILNNLEDKTPLIPCRDLDNYIVKSGWKDYKQDIFFQYCYVILSKYQYQSKRQYVNYFCELYNALYELNVEKIKKIIEQLEHEIVNIFEIDEEQIMITKLLQTIFEKEEIINLIAQKLNDKEKFCYVFRSCLEDVEEMLQDIIFAVILLKSSCNVEKLIEIIEHKEDMEQYIIQQICKNLQIENVEDKEEKKKFLNYIYKQLVVEGYYFHGTNALYKENILEKGLSSNEIPLMIKEIKEINDIFEKYHLYMNFEGKIRELKLHQYYVTDVIRPAVMYAFQSPEYLSRFCSNGYHMEDTKRFDREAFWRRDYKVCKQNLEELLKEYQFVKEDMEIVLTNFDRLWEANVKTDTFPALFIGKKKNIGRDSSDKYTMICNEIENYSIKDMLLLFKAGDNIRDKRLSDINKESLSCVVLPNVNQMYQLKSLDKWSTTQYVTYKNQKYEPDIVIQKSPLRLKAIILKDGIEKTQKLDERIFMLSSKDVVVKLKEYYTINLDILIAEAGEALTKRGKKYIRQKRQEFSVEQVIEYNKKLIENSIEYWKKNKNQMPSNEKVEFVHMLLNELMVETMSMYQYKKYVIDIDAALIRLNYFSIDGGNKINRLFKQRTTDDQLVEEIMENITKSVELNYRPYYDLKGRFYDIAPRYA